MQQPRRLLNQTKNQLGAALPDELHLTLPPQPSILPPPPGDRFLVRNARRIEHATERVGKVKSRVSYIRPKNIKKRLDNRLNKLVGSMSFPVSAHVDVSIIIPIFNKCDLTLNCLKSILEKVPRDTSYEVLLVDNNSTDNSYQFSKLKGLVYIRNNENKGFVEGCNVGASKAKGDYLVFLNNDAIVTEGWLDHHVAVRQRC